MDTRIQKMRQRLAKHRNKITEMQTQAAEMEQEIKIAEDEQLGYLARAVANTLSGGIDEVFELLRELRSRPSKSGITDAHSDSANIPQAPIMAAVESYGGIHIKNEENGEVVGFESKSDTGETE